MHVESTFHHMCMHVGMRVRWLTHDVARALDAGGGELRRRAEVRFLRHALAMLICWGDIILGPACQAHLLSSSLHAIFKPQTLVHWTSDSNMTPGVLRNALLGSSVACLPIQDSSGFVSMRCECMPRRLLFGLLSAIFYSSTCVSVRRQCMARRLSPGTCKSCAGKEACRSSSSTRG